MRRPLTLILGGGRGTRLLPLTQKRAKPDVPFAGKYRLVDIPISNCFHAGFRQIYVLTQFNSASLNSHIASTYHFAPFEKDFVEIMAADQTYEHSEWSRGTADAVRSSLTHIRELHSPGDYLILSSDQLYRMDLLDFYRNHLEQKAELSVAVVPLTRSQVSELGVLRINASRRIVEFLEKPGEGADLSRFEAGDCPAISEENKKLGKVYLASMGSYLFSARALERALESGSYDFGKEVLPQCIPRLRVIAYVFNGYWEDIGTIRTFYEANLRLAGIEPPFNFYDEERPIYSTPSHLPASKVNYCTLRQSLAAEGCIITNAVVNNSIIGARMIVDDGAHLDGVVALGNDCYETPAQRRANRETRTPDLGIGRGSFVGRAIIDQNARIGNGCRIGVDSIERRDGDYESHTIVNGIIVVKHNAVIPDGAVL
jgi:glucose-1-phosphate adenylyltransferase